jgi:hypothetical protein
VNTRNIDWRTFAIILIVFLLIVPALLGQVGQLIRIPPINIITAFAGAVWLILAGIAPWRGGRRPLGSDKVTYWRGQRIVTKQPARARIRSTSGVQLVGSLWHLALGLGSAYAGVIALLRLVGLS